ncbi:hypothetical protein BDA96_04G340300 [Sorghum bicolor]|uniref:Uncharacterized protein n=2 Tax=Sorghum bicolor TaxID=4558 RepID=A0A921R7F6_SORBI|nr:hypothetical protein BDA96_04G340300 [Sorghum bicolor]KXG31215.1 hypothetical protein SORBI_3004G317800 [Sorghum bicolor]
MLRTQISRYDDKTYIVMLSFPFCVEKTAQITCLCSPVFFHDRHEAKHLPIPINCSRAGDVLVQEISC